MTNERLEKIEEKIEQLKNQKKAIVQREKEKERKSRTRKLIQIGAILDSIGINTLDKAEIFKKRITANKDKYQHMLSEIETEILQNQES